MVTRVLEDGDEIVQVDLPAVVSVLANINEPRIPSVTQILKAGRKPMEVLELGELKVDAGKDLVITERTCLEKNVRR